MKPMVTASEKETVPLGCKHRVSAPATLMSPTPTCGVRSTRHSAAMGIMSHMSMRQSAAEVMISSRRGMDRVLHNGREGIGKNVHGDESKHRGMSKMLEFESEMCGGAK
jgi:hypothetical protein